VQYVQGGESDDAARSAAQAAFAQRCEDEQIGNADNSRPSAAPHGMAAPADGSDELNAARVRGPVFGAACDQGADGPEPGAEDDGEPPAPRDHLAQRLAGVARPSHDQPEDRGNVHRVIEVRLDRAGRPR